MTKWPMVPLGDVMSLDMKATPVHADQEYPNFGIYSFGRGLFSKPPISGATTSANSLYQVREGQFIYSRLFAFEGAYGLVGEEFDGYFISNEYPHFDCDPEQLSPAFLVTYFKWQKAWERAAMLSTGMGDRRRRIQPEQLLKMVISLPPLREQKRLVEYVDCLSVKINEAKVLRCSANESVQILWEQALSETFDAISKNSISQRFGDVCSVVRGGSPRPAGSLLYYDGDIPFLKVGDLTRDEKKTVELHTATIKQAGLSRTRWVEPGTLMLTNSGATLGVPKICTFGTTFNDGIQAFLGLPNELNKEYLYYFLRAKTRWFREWAARGQGQPNLNTEMVKQMTFPCPDSAIQLRTVQFLDGLRQKLNELESQQLLVQDELAAILPAALDKVFNRNESKA